MDKLIVKNFGPLKDVEIELNKINLFIGENGSGKSVLAKLITIILNFSNNNNEKLLKSFFDYHIDFITKNTFIELKVNNELLLSIADEKIIFSELLQNFYKIDMTYSKQSADLVKIKETNHLIANSLKKLKKIKTSKISNFFNKIFNKQDVDIETLNSLLTKNNVAKNEIDQLNDEIEEPKIIFMDILKQYTPQYIQAERNFISLFNKSLSTLLVADVPLPKFLLHFSSEFEKAGNTIKELNVLNVKYVNTDSQNRHKIYYDDNESLDLSESSSGIQSAIPLYLTVKYLSEKHRNIIIEEPEQNLFPKAQKETVEFIIENINEDNALFMMTHSPYILTSLNNLILANDVKEQKGLDAIKGIVDEKHCVAFEDVSAYSIVDGKAIDIMDKEDRLIGVNVIDSISDEVSHTFDTLLSKLD